MKLMVLIDGYGHPYNIGDVLKHRKIDPVQASGRIQKITQPSNKDMSLQGQKINKAISSYKRNQNSKSTQRSRLILAKEIMSSPTVFCSPNDTLKNVWDIIREKRFRHLPISTDGKKVIGIISDRDILKHAPYVATATETVHANTPIKDIMTTRVLTSLPNTEIREIARAFFEERIGCVPIVNDDTELQGIITRSDILRTLMNNAPLELWG